MFSDAEENLRHFIRQRKFWRRDARGNLELSRFPLQTKHCLSQFATGGSPGVIQRRGVGRQRRNALKPLRRAAFTGFPSCIFMHFMVKCICLPSVCSASFPQSRDITVLALFREYSCYSWLNMYSIHGETVFLILSILYIPVKIQIPIR